MKVFHIIDEDKNSELKDCCFSFDDFYMKVVRFTKDGEERYLSTFVFEPASVKVHLTGDQTRFIKKILRHDYTCIKVEPDFEYCNKKKTKVFDKEVEEVIESFKIIEILQPVV